MYKRLAIAVTLLLCCGAALASSKAQTQCQPPPALKFEGSNPIEEASKAGNITVVALLDAKCGYCILQAELLQRLKKKLEKKGMRRITYVIINKKSSRGMKKMFGKTSGIRVYESEKEGTWKKLKGLKDDFLIYDRCGLLAYHLDHSVTYLGWPIVRNHMLLTDGHIHSCKKQCPKGKPIQKAASMPI